MRDLLFLFLTFGCVIGSSCPASAAEPQPLLGMTLEKMKKTDFFTFFNLGQTTTDTDAQKRAVVTFKPRGGDFREMVVVKATLGDDKRIRALSLNLTNSFVDDRHKGIFARDFVKSLLNQALKPDEVKEISDLINEIEWGMKGMTTIGRKPPKLPDPPTPGYQTYLGKRPSFEQTIGGTKLEMRRPQDGPDKGHLTITVSVDK